MRGLLTSLLILLGAFLFIGFSGIAVDIGDIGQSDTTEIKDGVKEDEALISRVIDGDTILVINSEGEEERVRLLLIDTPESVHSEEPVQPYGKEASDFAKKHLRQGKKVTIERGNPDKDKYDRTLAYIFVDGVNFNQLMIEEGYARIAYVYEPNTKYLEEFKKAENQAKEQKKNIWSVEGYVTSDGFDTSVMD